MSIVHCADVWYIGKLAYYLGSMCYNYLLYRVFYTENSRIFGSRLMQLNSEIQLKAYMRIFEYSTSTLEDRASIVYSVYQHIYM